MPISKNSKKVLIITSSGGGGLLQAANAKEQEIKAQDPNAIVIHRDVMKDWMGEFLGGYLVSKWNRAQIKGSVRAQSFFGKATPFVEFLFWPSILIGSLYIIFKEGVDQVLDLQVMGTSAVIKAIRIYNWRRKKNLFLEKVLVDLPTKKATHYFFGIKSLNDKDRKLFKLITIPPMLEDGQTEEEFWKGHCNLTLDDLQYEDCYVRQSFVKYRNLERKHEEVSLRTRFQNEEEKELIKKTALRGDPTYREVDGEFEFSIPPNTRVFTVLLGSQPANKATLNYVKKFTEIARSKQCQNLPIHLFVFCANHTPNQLSLLRRVADFVEKMPDFPSTLTVIPMSFQKDDVLAPLFFRSDITCTRSGGQTAMELMTVGRGKILVHSEAKKRSGNLTNDELLNGIPCWESASASYLQQKIGAEIVTPEIIAPLIYKFYSSVSA